MSLRLLLVAAWAAAVLACAHAQGAQPVSATCALDVVDQDTNKLLHFDISILARTSVPPPPPVWIAAAQPDLPACTFFGGGNLFRKFIS